MDKTNRPKVTASAQCACGAVKVTIDGPIRSMLLCSCLDCQRASGTGHASVALVSAEGLVVTGQTKSFDTPSDSGAIFTRHFCPTCGTPLFGQSSRAPDVRMLPVGLFAGSNDWFVPNQLIFARSHQAWDDIADTIPQHQKYRLPQT